MKYTTYSAVQVTLKKKIKCWFAVGSRLSGSGCRRKRRWLSCTVVRPTPTGKITSAIARVTRLVSIMLWGLGSLTRAYRYRGEVGASSAGRPAHPGSPNSHAPTMHASSSLSKTQQCSGHGTAEKFERNTSTRI